jgi:hypothetical protein
MKYLLTESQINKFIDQVIQETLQEIKDKCEVPDADTWPGWLNFDDCDVANQIVKIVVNDVEKEEVKPNLQGKFYPRFRVWVNLYYTSLFTEIGQHNIGYVISYRILQKYKIKLNVLVQEEFNINTDRQW